MVRRRRMCRAFLDQPVPVEVLDRMVDLARRSPSAGFTQGTEFVLWHGPEEMGRFWSVAADDGWRADPSLPGLLRAAAAVVPLAAPAAYVARYNEPDKAAAGWHDAADWPVPYWTVDAAMATMSLLLAATDAGLGALFFTLGDRATAVCSAFGVPAELEPIGAVLLGWPDPAEAPTGSRLRRARRPFEEIVHRGSW